MTSCERPSGRTSFGHGGKRGPNEAIAGLKAPSRQSIRRDAAAHTMSELSAMEQSMPRFEPGPDRFKLGFVEAVLSSFRFLIAEQGFD
jgi:hypothetical protein